MYSAPKTHDFDITLFFLENNPCAQISEAGHVDCVCIIKGISLNFRELNTSISISDTAELGEDIRPSFDRFHR